MSGVLVPLAFAVAAGAGAATRHGANQLAVHHRRPGWLATLAVNVVGAFALGVLVGSGPGSTLATVAGTGFCGSLTTFSTFSLDASMGTVTQRGQVIVANLALGLLAVFAGHALTT